MEFSGVGREATLELVGWHVLDLGLFDQRVERLVLADLLIDVVDLSRADQLLTQLLRTNPAFPRHLRDARVDLALVHVDLHVVREFRQDEEQFQLTLRRVASQVDDAVKQVQLVAETTLIGGARRQVRVLLDPSRLASRNLSAAGIVPMLRQANRQSASGGLTSHNQEIAIETGAFLTSAQDVGNVVVGACVVVVVVVVEASFDVD